MSSAQVVHNLRMHLSSSPALMGATVVILGDSEPRDGRPMSSAAFLVSSFGPVSRRGTVEQSALCLQHSSGSYDCSRMLVKSSNTDCRRS